MSSLRRTDLLSLSNLRNDGRKANELRRMTIQMSPVDNNGCSGSALVQMGLTVVLACVMGPMDCSRRSDELPDRAILEVTLRTAPFAPSAGDRRTTNPSTDRRLVEQSSLIQKAFEASLLLNLHPRTRIVLDLTVLADDGGRLCAAINASTLALVDAGIAMKDLLCSCSAGSLSGSINIDSDVQIIDLNQKEISSYNGESAVYLPCATMPQRSTVVLAQCESRLPSIKTFEKVLGAAMEGCEMVFEIMQASLRERVSKVLAAKTGNAAVDVAL